MTIFKTITTALSVNNLVFQNNVISDAFLNDLTHIHVPFVFINLGQIICIGVSFFCMSWFFYCFNLIPYKFCLQFFSFFLPCHFLLYYFACLLRGSIKEYEDNASAYQLTDWFMWNTKFPFIWLKDVLIIQFLKQHVFFWVFCIL